MKSRIGRVCSSQLLSNSNPASSMKFSPPPDRIRQLCAKALTAEPPQLEQIMGELREALREHAGFVRAMASHVLTHLPADRPKDEKSKDAA